MIDFTVHDIDKTASSNQDVFSAAEKGAAEGYVVWTLQQTAGKGRHGRVWHSPPGNLYFSVLLRPACSREEYWQYSFITAVAMGDTLSRLMPKARLEFKWPNDVLVNGKKIGGILLETGDTYLVVGVGLNVLHMPENPLYPVTSMMAETGQALPLRNLLDALLKDLNHLCTVVDDTGFSSIRAAWLARARRGSMRVRLPGTDGDGHEIHGEFGDLHEDGHLSLILKDGTTKKIHTGDVFF